MCTHRFVAEVGIVGVEGDGLNVIGMCKPSFCQWTNGHVVEVIWKVETEKLIAVASIINGNRKVNNSI